MTIPRWAPSVGLVVAVVAGLYWYGASERRIGAAKAAEAQAKQEVRAAADSIAALELQRTALLAAVVAQDRAFHVKQAATDSTAARYRMLAQRLRQALAARADTASTADSTTPLLAPVLAACDSLALAATDTLPCHARVAARDSVIRADSLERAQHVAREEALERENAAIRKQLPGAFARLLGSPPVRIATLVAAFLVGRASR